MSVKLARALRMPLPEVAGRGRQEAAKWLDRLGMLPRWATPSSRASAHTPEIRPARFFAGAADAGRTARGVMDLAQYHDRIIAAAEAVCAGRFDLLGYCGLDFGDPVDWHLDPISGRRAPLVHWSRIDPLDQAVLGDSKVIWELNRHQWLLQLGQAYRFTGEERYALTFARYIEEWMRANPTGLGINWASSLEVSFRLISWCWALILFHGSPVLSGCLRVNMLRAIEVHAHHVARYLSHYFAPNTHLTGEALGLFYAGVLFPDRHRASHWQALGARILVAQCDRHILPDGVYFEHATYYQRYTAEFYLHFLIFAARNGIPVPARVAERVQRLLDFLVAVRSPDGSMPLIGDADGGWLLPLVTRTAGDLRGVLAVAAAFFERPDYAWAASGPAPETLWLLGLRGGEAFDALTPAPPTAPSSRCFDDGGYALMRDGWADTAHQLIVDVGPATSRRGSHWHADLLSLQCCVSGEPCIVDPGTPSYADPAWREFFRSAAAHSTVRVDGLDHVRRTGPFRFDLHPRARLRQWLSTEAYDLVDAEHDLYGGLPDPVTHRRRVLFVKPRFWVIVDDLHGTAEHLVELCFQFAPLEVTLTPDLWCRARGRCGGELLLRPFAAVPLVAAVYEGAAAPIRGWYSGDYGRRAPAPALVYTARTRLPLRITTLLLPAHDEQHPVPIVSAREDDRGGLVRLAMEDGTEIHVDDDDIRIGHAHGS